MKNKNQFRQGDVLIERIDELPGNTKKKKNTIVAVGESMNHAHAMFGEVDVLEKGEEVFLDVREESELKHILLEAGIATDNWTKEHHPVKLKPGKYKVVQQQQYDPYKKAAERVRD